MLILKRLQIQYNIATSRSAGADQRVFLHPLSCKAFRPSEIGGGLQQSGWLWKTAVKWPRWWAFQGRTCHKFGSRKRRLVWNCQHHHLSWRMDLEEGLLGLSQWVGRLTCHMVVLHVPVGPSHLGLYFLQTCTLLYLSNGYSKPPCASTIAHFKVHF